MGHILGVHLDYTEISGQAFTCAICIKTQGVSEKYNENSWN